MRKDARLAVVMVGVLKKVKEIRETQRVAQESVVQKNPPKKQTADGRTPSAALSQPKNRNHSYIIFQHADDTDHF